MRHDERIQHVKQGTDYKAPLLACNEHVEGLVECGLIVKASDRSTLSPETRALDAIGTQVLRELKQRAEMIVALVERLNVVETELEQARLLIRERGWERDLRVLEEGGEPERISA